MAVTAWTQSDLDTLRAAISGGVKKVVYDGPPRREVEYHSLSEMWDALAKMTREVNGTTDAPARRLVKTKKGFRS